MHMWWNEVGKVKGLCWCEGGSVAVLFHCTEAVWSLVARRDVFWGGWTVHAPCSLRPCRGSGTAFPVFFFFFFFTMHLPGSLSQFSRTSTPVPLSFRYNDALILQDL